MIERLTADDAKFLHLEDEIMAMHMMTIAIFDGPEPPFKELQERISSRVVLVPRLRQRVMDVPFRVERPVWVDDPEFNLDYHLRHTGLPKGGNLLSLNRLVGRVLSQRLDRGKPLWEMWIVSGLPKRQWAIISKAHHSIIDGVSGTDPLALMVDQVKMPRHRPADRWSPNPVPSANDLLNSGLTDLMLDPGEQFRIARRVVKRPWQEMAKAAESLVGHKPVSGLNRALGPHRRWIPAVVDADAIRRARTKFDVSTNDLVLALISSGFRTMFEHSNTPVPESLRSLVPLAVASADAFINEVTALEADLPVGEEDLESMASQIAGQTASHSNHSRAVAGDALMNLRGLSAPTLCALGVRAATLAGADRDGIETVAINAPGPRETVTLLDQPMVAVIPAIPLAAGVRIGVAVMSYQDQFHFGITGDRDAAPEVAFLAKGIEKAASTIK